MSRILLSTWIVALSACSATSVNTASNVQPINLSEDKDSLETLWQVAKPDYPRYPSEAAKKRISGCVEFAFTINSDGKAQAIKVIKAVPDSIFIRAATKSLKSYRWQPTEANITRQPAITTLQLDFSTSPVIKVPECVLDEQQAE